MAAALLEGLVAIIIDNTPFALIVPVVFGQFLQAPEDYYESFDFIRTFRWLALLAATAAPNSPLGQKVEITLSVMNGQPLQDTTFGTMQ